MITLTLSKIRNLLVILLLLITSFSVSYAQNLHSKVNWLKNYTWEQVKEKAFKERKYILLDCYATWCGACKKMDEEVLIQDSIAGFVNANFISLKVQIDSSGNDKEEIRLLYPDAKNIQKSYSVSTLPTFLFFDYNSKLVHKEVGTQNQKQFMIALKRALNPQQQFYTLLNNYKAGTREYLSLPYLVSKAKEINDESSSLLANDYINNYLLKINYQHLTPENIEFIGKHTLNSSDKSFKFFYENSDFINPLVKWTRNYAGLIVGNIINKESIVPVLKNAKLVGRVNWDSIQVELTKLYGLKFAYPPILSAKINWCLENKDWNNAIKYTVEKIDRYGLDTLGIQRVYTNNMIGSLIFIHCNDVKILNKAIGWMKVIMSLRNNFEPGVVDIYAALLYKVGRKMEGLRWQKKAYELELDRSKKGKFKPDPSYKENLERMRRGEPAKNLKNV